MPKAKGWFRRPKGRDCTLYVWLNAAGRERARMVGPAGMTDEEAWLKVGELGLNIHVGKPDPTKITFGELALSYFANHKFNKTSTKELHEQIINRIVVPRWRKVPALSIKPKALREWFLEFDDVESSTRGKYRSVMSAVYTYGQCEELIPMGEEYNPCKYVKGPEFSSVTDYEAMALEPEDILAILSYLPQPVYELALLVATCALRISEPLGLCWRNVLWNRGQIAIKQTFVHAEIQKGAKTKLSRSRVEAPKLLLDALMAWRKQTIYAGEDDFIFPSEKLGGRQPRSASMLVEDYIRPAAVKAGVIRVEDGVTYDRDGEVVKRFGFHNLGRHSLATWLMDEQENPAVVQAIMRHAKLNMTLYYSHSRRKSKLRAQQKWAKRVAPNREQPREQKTIQ